MRLSRLFTDQSLTALESIELGSKQSHYLSKVLRLKKGQRIILFNGSDHFDYHCIISHIGKAIELIIEKRTENHHESPLISTMFLALSKNDHIDLSIQKCTELGVNALVIFNSERTQIPLKSNRLEKKLQHWNRIAQSACEQCGRSIVPTISFQQSLSHALSDSHAQLQLMLDFEGASILELVQNSSAKSIDILLGAEGGLSINEIQLAQQCNFKKVRLGPRVLRTETAAISALSLIQMLSGDLK